MLRIQKSVSAPGKQYTQDGERVDYPRETYDRYHEIAGRFTCNNLSALLGSERYFNMDDDARRKAAGRAIREARSAARDLLDDPDYALPAKGSGAINAFQEYLADDPFADFPDAAGGNRRGRFRGAAPRLTLGRISRMRHSATFSARSSRQFPACESRRAIARESIRPTGEGVATGQPRTAPTSTGLRST